MPCSSANVAISARRPRSRTEPRSVSSGGAAAPSEVAVQAPTAATASSAPTSSAKRSLRDLIVSPLLSGGEDGRRRDLGRSPSAGYDLDSIPLREQFQGRGQSLLDVDQMLMLALRRVAVDLGQLVVGERRGCRARRRWPRAARRCSLRRASRSRAGRAASTRAPSARASGRGVRRCRSARESWRAPASVRRSGDSELGRLAREPSGIPSRYLSVSMPWARGEKRDAADAELAQRVEQVRPRSSGSASSTRAGGSAAACPGRAGSRPPPRVFSAEYDEIPT